MSEVQLTIGGHHYTLACAEGEEDALRHLAEVVDAQIQSARLMAGGLSETRQLLFAAILLAEQLETARPSELAGQPTDATRLTAMAKRITAVSTQISALLDMALESSPATH